MSTISADRLLRHAERDVATRPGLVTSGAASIGRFVLGRAATDRLIVDDVAPGRAPKRRVFGAPIGELPPGAVEAHVTVYDDRAYAALVREGSIGFGRGSTRWRSQPAAATAAGAASEAARIPAPPAPAIQPQQQQAPPAPAAQAGPSVGGG